MMVGFLYPRTVPLMCSRDVDRIVEKREDKISIERKTPRPR